MITIQTELADGLPIGLGIASEVREALVNFVFNAVDAMPEGGDLDAADGIHQHPH